MYRTMSENLWKDQSKGWFYRIITQLLLIDLSIFKLNYYWNFFAYYSIQWTFFDKKSSKYAIENHITYMDKLKMESHKIYIKYHFHVNEIIAFWTIVLNEFEMDFSEIETKSECNNRIEYHAFIATIILTLNDCTN